MSPFSVGDPPSGVESSPASFVKGQRSGLTEGVEDSFRTRANTSPVPNEPDG